MILVNQPFTYQRPAPVFNAEPHCFSTKKAKSACKFVPPKAPVKSCPVRRVFSRIQCKERPQPVSFRNDSDTSFIEQSPIYRPEKSDSYFEQCYVIEEKLGAGSFGEVYRVRSKEDGRLYACKKTLLRFRGESDRRRRMEEVQKHENLPKHPNCVQFFRAWEEKQHLYMLMEVCQASLAHLAEDKHDLPESFIWEVLVDLLQGVNHLHSHNLLHMDIKPENIFIGLDGLCKLGDFGLVVDVPEDDVVEAVEGDPKYLAPECLNSTFGPVADIFSVGMTILELATDLDLPKHGYHWHQLRNGQLPPVASTLSTDLQSVLMMLLTIDPSHRPRAHEVLEMPIVQKVVRRKKILDAWRRRVNQVRSCFIQVWIWLMLMFSVVVLPLQPLRRLSQSKVESSKHDHSTGSCGDSDLAAFSDDEGFDSSYAHPISDLSSSSDSFISSATKPPINSTPIIYRSHRNSRLLRSPKSHSFISDLQVNNQSPFQRKCVPANILTPFKDEIMCEFAEKTSYSEVDSKPKPQTLPDEEVECEKGFNLNITSRNLMDMFNAAELSDEDE
ncbi:membrane-associated tyrosine- and threonine-specific cdc2-inhibitory kinase-like isoform X2 [Oratosquilla oratoria]|uniref:membrane-associated tyrosine- and threonine-specific cdc2-inhibitory kinase-like isoform X2 n=1 Tax=Oratosquilla oratoria TaxID=337810 RepID=UPI003F77116B